jgi:hypothetical protein
MAETKWTPGPWVASGITVWSDRPGKSERLFQVLRFGAGRDDERQANVDLIAAAPDLYEALREQAESHDADGTPCFCGNTDSDEHAAYCRSARSALAAARGDRHD